MTIALLQPELEEYPGLAVRYRSYGGHQYNAVVAHVHDDGTAELLVHSRCICCKVGMEAALGVSVLHKAAYDSTGQQCHSWQKRTD